MANALLNIQPRTIKWMSWKMFPPVNPSVHSILLRKTRNNLYRVYIPLNWSQAIVSYNESDIEFNKVQRYLKFTFYFFFLIFMQTFMFNRAAIFILDFSIKSSAFTALYKKRTEENFKRFSQILTHIVCIRKSITLTCFYLRQRQHLNNTSDPFHVLLLPSRITRKR